MPSAKSYRNILAWIYPREGGCKLNKTQRLVFLLGILAICFMGSCPPWKEAGPKGLPRDYAPIYAPPSLTDPEKGLEIDFARLLLQIGVVAVLTGGLITASSTQVPQEEENDKQARAPEVLNTVTTEELEARDATPSASSVLVEGDDKGDYINLPGGTVYGEFLVEADDDPDSWEWYADAVGSVKLPKGRPVQLEIVKKNDVDLSFLTLLKEDSLHSMDLTNCRLKDWDLSHLSKLKGLKELDLTGSTISNEAINYVGGLANLEKLWLDGTKIDDQSLATLGRLAKLKKLSLRKTKISEAGLEEIREKLEGCVVEV